MGRKAGVKHLIGQNAGLDNTSGIDPKIFNFIFALITGSTTLGSGHKVKMDVWDYEPGVRFFGHILFGKAEDPRRRKMKVKSR
jgi:hypothetical protein